MTCFELDDPLPQFSVFLLQFADGIFQLLDAGEVDFPRAFGIVGSLGVCEEGFLVADVMEARLDVPGP